MGQTEQLYPEEPLCHIKWLTAPIHSYSPLHTAHNNAKEKQRVVAISQGCIPQWTGKTGNRPTPKPQWVKLETRLRLFIQTMFTSSINRGPLCAELTSSTRQLFEYPKLNIELEGLFKNPCCDCGCSPIMPKLTFSVQFRITFRQIVK